VFVEGDLVRIIGFDVTDSKSVYNGEVGNIVGVKGATVVVKTAVSSKVMEVAYDKVMHARDFRTGGEGGGEQLTQEGFERQYFDEFDLNRDGQLGRHELRSMFVKKDGAHVADAAVEEMLAELDADESDTIDNSEFWREIAGAREMRLS